MSSRQPNANYTMLSATIAENYSYITFEQKWRPCFGQRESFLEDRVQYCKVFEVNTTLCQWELQLFYWFSAGLIKGGRFQLDYLFVHIMLLLRHFWTYVNDSFLLEMVYLSSVVPFKFCFFLSFKINYCRNPQLIW